jgi:hypothetical protein
MITDTITFRLSRKRLTVAHALEHLDVEPKKKPEMVECAGEKELDLKPLLDFKERHARSVQEVLGVKVTPSTFVPLAVARVLSRGEFRLLNGYWNACSHDRMQDTVKLYRHVHLGIAYDEGIPAVIDEERKRIDFPATLCIPTLHNPNTEVKAFLTALESLLERMREDHKSGTFNLKKVMKEEVLGGHTFIFNNLGTPRIGHTRGHSRLTARTSAMLNMGRMEDNGKTIFQVFFDHRMFDASMLTRFLNAMHQELIEGVLEDIRELVL